MLKLGSGEWFQGLVELLIWEFKKRYRMIYFGYRFFFISISILILISNVVVVIMVLVYMSADKYRV